MTAPKRILIAGYYGFSNTGDEAVLASIVSGLRRQAGDDLDIAVLSAQPEETARTYGVRSVGRMDFRRVRESIRECDLFISGGGSLLQDATSFKSLVYYLALIEMSERAGREVMVLGQGIGPLRRTVSRMLTRRALDRVSIITVRDEESADLLAQIGVKRPRIEVTADPTFALRPCPAEEAHRLLTEAGVSPDEDVVAVSLREWPESPEIESAAIDALADLARRDIGAPMSPSASLAREDTGAPARLLLIPMQMPGDVEMARRIRRAIGERIAVLPDGCSPEQVMGAVSLCGMVVAMRLHALIFAASVGIPALGISYDPKVASFMAAAGQDGISLGEVTSGLLADRVIESWNRRSDLAVRLTERVPKLRELAEQNFRLAAELLRVM